MQEELNLPFFIKGDASPKSTSGRDGILSRLLTESPKGKLRYDHVSEGYKGKLWLEIVPQIFPITLKKGVSLNQLRFLKGDVGLGKNALKILHALEPLLFYRDGTVIPIEEIEIDAVGTGKAGIVMHIDLKHGNEKKILGYRSKQRVNTAINFYTAITPKPEDQLVQDQFWEPIYGPRDGLVLEPGYLYILSTIERIKSPAQLCFKLAITDHSMGHFKAHFAGFFDSGWGCVYEKNSVSQYQIISEQSKGTTATLEVVIDGQHPIIIKHGHPIAKAIYEVMSEKPEEPYKLIKDGEERQQNYGWQQGVQLSKHFKKVNGVLN